MTDRPTIAHAAPDAHGLPYQPARARRLAFAVAAISLCSAFEWPGRIAHLAYQAAHGSASERRQAVRLLAQYPSTTLPALLGALDDDDLEVQLAAAEALADRRAAEAGPTLLDWLSDKDPARRAAGVRGLGAIGDPRAGAGLARALADADASVRLAAVEALTAQGSAASNPLAIGLDDKDSRVRARVAEALAAAPDPAAFAALSGHVRDEAIEVRVNCLRALGKLRDPRSVAVLISALNDADEVVRLAALAALGDSAQSSAVAPLRASLSAAPRLARTALAALGRIEDQAAQVALLGALDDPELAAASADALLARLQRRAAGASEAQPRTPTSSLVPADPASPRRAAGEGGRAQTENSPHADEAEIVLALAKSLERATNPEQATLLAGALGALGAFLPIAQAKPSLMDALATGRGDPRIVSAALLPLAPSELLPLLLERLERATPAERGAVLDALAACFSAGLGDGRAVEPLAAALGQARPGERGRLLQLLGATGAARVLPLLLTAAGTASPHELVTIASAIGALPGSADGRRALRPLMAAAEPGLREAAANAFARSAESADIAALLDGIDAAGPFVAGDWLALGGALGRLGPTLDPKLRERVRRSIRAGLRDSKPAIAALALMALRRLHDPAGTSLLTERLRSPSASARAAAVLALGDFPSEDARRLLRYMLMNDAPPVVLSAELALGELGDQRDSSALLKAAERGVWPLPAAAAYALARIAQRGAGKKHALQRALCALGRDRDVLVRANVAAGLSALGSERCDDRVDPSVWLGPAESPILRRAAAAWALAGADVDVQARARKLCAERPDDELRAACHAGQPSAASGTVDIHAYAADGRSDLTDRLVAVSGLGAGIFVGPTDANGHLLVPAALGARLHLIDPADTDFAPQASPAHDTSELQP
jgi:HEAT repeat protein